jgi:hypothetical protein
VTTSAGGTGAAQSVRKYACRAGDVLRISGQAKVVVGAGAIAIVVISFRDASGTQIATGDRRRRRQEPVAPLSVAARSRRRERCFFYIGCVVNAASSACVFDEIHIARMQTAFEVVPLNTSGRSTSTVGALSQSGVSARSTSLRERCSSVTVLSHIAPGPWTPRRSEHGTSMRMMRDSPAEPSLTRPARTNSTCTAGNGRIYFGKIVRPWAVAEQPARIRQAPAAAAFR